MSPPTMGHGFGVGIGMIACSPVVHIVLRLGVFIPYVMSLRSEVVMNTPGWSWAWSQTFVYAAAAIALYRRLAVMMRSHPSTTTEKWKCTVDHSDNHAFIRVMPDRPEESCRIDHASQ